jgi:hypothetical protein
MMEEHQPVGAVGRASVASAVHGTRDDTLSDPRALQILSTEHWSLIAARSLAYNEAFSRAGMFLSFLSATLIVIGFLVASDSLHGVVLPVAVLLLAADLFIGMATVGRLLDAGAEDLHAVRGMNRIRHAYVEILPGLERYFVSGLHDDQRGILATYGNPPSSARAIGTFLHAQTTTIGMVGTIDAILGGALATLVCLGLGTDVRLAVIIGVVAAALGFLALLVVGVRSAVGRQTRAQSLFPSPD